MIERLTASVVELGRDANASPVLGWKGEVGFTHGLRAVFSPSLSSCLGIKGMERKGVDDVADGEEEGQDKAW